MSGVYLGISVTVREENAAYLKSWCKEIKEEPKFLLMISCISLTVVKLMQWFNIYSDRKITSSRIDTFSASTGEKPGRNFCLLYTSPVRPEIMNDINLKPKELERLQDNEIITKTINNEKYLVQLDLSLIHI